ncbi:MULTISPECIES: hypothetical protein [Pseudanabaena]|uniref:Chromosome segregation ATPase-like protein n=2 Tax=Pseudanabaena TaxID=1152 RepID=L8MVI5_9CYAN|nr:MULTISPECIES: hypothetical protein [Pseudanabaena]ELS30779.1 hypothetical protein Pse7429DRAFT_4024 [Pseudanabaena biceps PCC 7429]MDG3496947.1 hypothetical protein [Pseudanabaena catenata USMAC16]
MKREAALREVSVQAVPVNDDDELDALLKDVKPKEKAIAKVANMLLNNFEDLDLDSIDAFSDDWSAETTDHTNHQNSQTNAASTEKAEKALLITELITERDHLHTELETLKAQHQFECEYVDQLEQEIISVTNDRDRQIAALTNQITQLQNQISQLQASAPMSDDRDLSDRLAVHVLQIEEEFQHRLALAIEIETQKIKQQHLQEISDKNELIHQLQCQNTALDISQQTLTKELETSQSLLRESTKTIEIAQIKLSEVKSQRDQFEEELIQHLSNRAQLQQSLRGLENEYVSDLTRVQELEQQIEDLQNQVLQQASKTSEYEAAIQHWKEQSVRHQHHALQLSGALDRLLAEKPAKQLTPNPVAESEPNYRSPRSLDAFPETAPLRSPRPTSKVDLPSFLVRPR